MKLRKRTQRFVKEGESTGRAHKRQPFTALRRNAKEVKNYRVVRKILLISVAIASATLMIGYAVSLLYNRTGRFSVAVGNSDATFAITLCETPDFSTRSSRLVNDQQVKINNICGSILPANVDSVNGEHNGENYLAYTFYCKNVGAVATAIDYEITFNNVTNNVDECVRVRLYVNGTPTDYAKTRSDGAGPETHFCDRAFAGKYVVCYGRVNNLRVDEYAKFTVVIWLEGDDADCNDSVLNGKIKFDMNIEAKPVDTVDGGVKENEE